MNLKSSDVPTLRKLIYSISGFEVSGLEIEKESQAYTACRFFLNGFKVICRTAKITPTKTGQFVTIWKRIGDGEIQPFHASDEFDVIIVITKSGNQIGYFQFPKEVLVRERIVSTDLKEGKRGIRVYPPWDNPISKQAQKTQG